MKAKITILLDDFLYDVKSFKAFSMVLTVTPTKSVSLVGQLPVDLFKRRCALMSVFHGKIHLRKKYVLCLGFSLPGYFAQTYFGYAMISCFLYQICHSLIYSKKSFWQVFVLFLFIYVCFFISIEILTKTTWLQHSLLPLTIMKSCSSWQILHLPNILQRVPCTKHETHTPSKHLHE